MSKGNVKKLVIAEVLSFSAAAVGSIANVPNIPTWYANLQKPFFNPPNWVFPVVWTALYFMIGLSLYYVWTAPEKKAYSKREAYRVFVLQLVLNAIWSIAFFGLHSPIAALSVIVLLFGSIVATMLQFKLFSTKAVLLLIPYILWTCFAVILNIAIIALNT